MNTKIFFMSCLLAALLSSCASMNKTQKGALYGAGGGAALGTIIGKISGNTGLGTAIGAAVGGTTGAIIGKKMDKQAAEIQQQVPDAKVERIGEGINVEFNSNILYGINSYNLTSDAMNNLNKLVYILNNYPDTNIEIQGHTDNTGSEIYNQNLSEKRAGSVSSYLMQSGVSGNRITTKGFGELVPKYANDTAEGRTMNRRVEFVITANQSMINQAQREAGE